MNNDNINYNERKKQIKEKLMEDTSLLNNYELLEIILSFATNNKNLQDCSIDIIDKFKNLKTILTANLSNINGLNKETEIFFATIRELFDRIEKEKVISKKDMPSPEDVYNYFKYSIALDIKEFFVIMFLDLSKAVIGHEIISKGTVNATNVFPREIAETAIKNNSESIILIHNHPSGKVIPSQADINLTKLIIDALKPFTINVIDHIIVSKLGYFSFNHNNIMPNK